MAKQKSKQANETPLNISLSGGGHRATLFSLGVFAFLVDAGLMGRVKEISSVSGGSLTNGVIAAGVASSPKSWCDFTREDWQNLIARISGEISGNDLLFKAAALGLLTLGVFLFRVLAWDLEGLTSVGFVVGSFIWSIAVVTALAGVLGLDRFELLVSLVVLAATWWVYHQLAPPALSLIWLNLLVIGMMMALSFLGASGRGSFWGHPLTWLYFSFVVWGLIVGLHLTIHYMPSAKVLFSIFSIDEWDQLTATIASIPAEFVAGVVLTLVSAGLFTQRNKIADIAFRRLLRRITGDDDFRLCDLDPNQSNIFCSTLVSSNTHIYFTNKGGKFHGLARQGLENRLSPVRTFDCKDMKLSKAMQMSSAFPGGFPYQHVRLRVGDRGELSEFLVSDGGIFDNSGTSWFFDLGRDETVAEDLLVVDAAPTSSGKNVSLHKWPFLQDILSVLGVITVAMSAVNERRSFITLKDDFYQDETKGKHFHVMARTDPGLTSARLIDDRDMAYPENPIAWAKLMQVIVETRRHYLATDISNRDREEFDHLLASLEEWTAKLQAEQVAGISNEKIHATDLEELRQNIQSAFDSLYYQMKNEDGTTSPLRMPHAFVEFNVPTTFRPLGAFDASNCLRRGYMHTMRQMYLITRGQTPLFEPDSVDSTEFYALAKGRPLHT